MKKYIVAECDDLEFDIDCDDNSYSTYEAARKEKERLEKIYKGTEFTVWEVD